ncbi:Dopamine D2-like receptor [Nymphon striatum]|nr:Dopamine D2-like receptor [Nymphon striatum]
MDGLEDDVGQNIAVSDSMPEISTTGIVQATFILITLFIIIVGNILIIISLLTKPSCNKESFSYYILSLAINDLLTGFLIFPFCVYPAIFQKRMYGDMLCRIEGYIGVTLWSITVYTFMWMAVDRYLAVKKPLRYDNIQTITRCKCWVIVSWVTSILLCSPPVLAFSRVRYYHHAFICLPEFSDMLAYSVTLFILILGPSTITIIYSYFYIFKTMYICNRTQSNGQNNLLCGGSMKETLSGTKSHVEFYFDGGILVSLVAMDLSWSLRTICSTYN